MKMQERDEQIRSAQESVNTIKKCYDEALEKLETLTKSKEDSIFLQKYRFAAALTAENSQLSMKQLENGRFQVRIGFIPMVLAAIGKYEAWNGICYDIFTLEELEKRMLETEEHRKERNIAPFAFQVY